MSALPAYKYERDDRPYLRPRPRRTTRQSLIDDFGGTWLDEDLTTAVFDVDETPSWEPATIERIVELTGLPTGWDGHNGQAVKVDVALFAIELLAQTLVPHAPAPIVVPLSFGGIQLEWHERDIDLEIEIAAPNQIFVSFEDSRTGEELEREFSTVYSEVTRILQMLATRDQQ